MDIWLKQTLECTIPFFMVHLTEAASLIEHSFTVFSIDFSGSSKFPYTFFFISDRLNQDYSIVLQLTSILLLGPFVWILIIICLIRIDGWSWIMYAWKNHWFTWLLLFGAYLPLLDVFHSFQCQYTEIESSQLKLGDWQPNHVCLCMPIQR